MYQIRKGWPSDGAIDEVVTAAPSATLKEGMIVTIDENRQATPSTDSDAKKTVGFLFGSEPMGKTFVALLSDAIIEVDAQHYKTDDSFAAGDALSAGTAENAGKFIKEETVDGSKLIVGRVISVNKTTGIMRLRWFSSK